MGKRQQEEGKGARRRERRILFEERQIARERGGYFGGEGDYLEIVCGGKGDG